MKIIKMTAENVKKLLVVEITPDGNLVKITGKNGAGKTAVLDSIWWALAGTRSHQPKPIRDGAEQAKITLDLGELIVERQFRTTQDGKVTTMVSVKTTDNAYFSSPQKVLDSLLGALSFDPLAFSKMNPVEQRDHLAKVLGYDAEKYDTEFKTVYDKRTDFNRSVKLNKALADGIEVPDDTPDNLVDIDKIRAKQKKFIDQNAKILQEFHELKNQHNDLDNQIAHASSIWYSIDDGIKAVQKQIEDLKNKMEEQEKEKHICKKNLDKLLKQRADFPELKKPEEKSTDSFDNTIDQAIKVNEAVKQKKHKNDVLFTMEKWQAKADECTKRLDEIKVEKKQAVEALEMPVENLTFDEDGLLLNGVPLEQASDAEKLRVSCAIAMQENTKLRVLRIQDGSLLDTDSLELLATLADDKDYQVWIEIVDTTGEVGFCIEDGRIK